MAQILLLEADRLIAQNLTHLLRRNGHLVNWEVQPQAALDNADRWRPDIVIVSLNLAGRSGIEFIYEFKSYGDWQHLPIILWSSADSTSLADAGLKQLNVEYFIQQPDTPLAELVERVEQLVTAPVT